MYTPFGRHIAEEYKILIKSVRLSPLKTSTLSEKQNNVLFGLYFLFFKCKTGTVFIFIRQRKMCKFIQTTEELNQLCLRLAEHKFVTVDTEFIREKTYWPQLCLIQIASVDEAACVDPLAPGINMQALFDLMQNKNVVKVFHAARQDIEIFIT